MEKGRLITKIVAFLVVAVAAFFIGRASVDTQPELQLTLDAQQEVIDGYEFAEEQYMRLIQEIQNLINNFNTIPETAE